nr:M56 family metallopeptidase [uncultured Psychroserpens sp.]
MDYLLKSSAVLFIFYACYQLFLQRDTFFQANRWFLLLGLIIASSIPFIVIPNYIEYTPVASGLEQTYITSNGNATPIAIQEEPFNYIALMTWIYFAGILFFFGKLAVEFLSLKKILNRSTVISSGAIKLMETNETVAPFSFFNCIVYNPNQFQNEELMHVINHEKVHTKQWHSMDTIIAQLSCILFWFNPIVWLYKKALQQNLEFIADQKAQYVSTCDKSYQTVLLKASVQNHQLAFTNNFYTSLIKKRIVMLHKSKSNKLNQLKFAVVLPLLALFMMSFNTKTIYVAIPIEDTYAIETTTEQTGDTEITISKDTTDAELKTIQDQLKEKGITFTYHSLKRNAEGEITNIKTDFKSADHSANYNVNGDNGIEAFRFKNDGESFSVGSIKKHKSTFVYETKDGETKIQGTGANVYVFENDDDDNDDENGQTIKIKTANGTNTVKVKANSQSSWIDKAGSKTKIKAFENGKTNIFISESEEPLFIIDGKAVQKSLFEDVDSDDIQSINVLKGKSAIASFGDKGKNGVIVMTKKGSKNLFVKADQSSNFNYNYNFGNAKGEQPLFIIDGKRLSEDEFKDLNPNNIDKIEIIKGENAYKVYGKKGENGVVVVNSKSSRKNKPIVVEVKDNNSWAVETSVSSVYFEDDNGKETAEFIISKHSTDAFIDKQKDALKALGINAKINKVRRNKAGEITGIKISLDDNNGRKSSASWKEKDQAIPDIVLGKSGDKLIVRAIN